MKRRLWLLTSIVAALLTVAVGVLWVRSFWYFDGVERRNVTRVVTLLSNRGRLALRSDTFNRTLKSGGGPGWWAGSGPAMVNPLMPVGPGARWDLEFLGVASRARAEGEQLNPNGSGTFWWAYWELIVPHAAVAGVSAIVAVWAGFRWRIAARWHARASGLCVHCRYDLRETPDRCPECGSLVGTLKIDS